ncbi:MAG: hypothetical protein RL186_19 [Pseudomonadota bacterium]
MLGTQALEVRSLPMLPNPRDGETPHIQPYGFVTVFAADWSLAFASTNCAAALHKPPGRTLSGPIDELFCPDAVHTIRNLASTLRRADSREIGSDVELVDKGVRYDLALHKALGHYILEAEPHDAMETLRAGEMIRTMFGSISLLTNVDDLAKEAVRLMYALCGYDRVVVYRFRPDGSGDVIAERAKPSLNPYIGLRYPACDVTPQEQAFLAKSPVQMVYDVDAVALPLASASPLLQGQPDLDRCLLRAPSAFQAHYLRNMGVKATFVLSLMSNGKLWGLLTCHHLAPRRLTSKWRAIAEIFGEMLALRIDHCEREAKLSYDAATRHIHNHLLAAVVEKGSVSENYTELAHQLTNIVPCDGTAFCIDGQVTLKGLTPNMEEFEGLRLFLEGVAPNQVFSTDEIGKIFAPGRRFANRAAGLLAIPISHVPRNYLVFFRQENAQQVIWAGNPHPYDSDEDPNIPRPPRTNFDPWQETLRGTCSPWTEGERRAAEALRITVLEVVLRLIGNTEAERDTSREKQELLIAELNHRVRNILSLIRGLISQSRINATDMDSFATVLGDRVHALARAHDQITAKSWGPGSLQTLISTEAAAYVGNANDVIRMSGPSVMLQPQAFSTVALVVHELITNAAKYGALKGQNGHVAVDWTLNGAGDLVMDWTEIGGPAVQAPSRRGFGSTMIEHSIPHELGGASRIAFRVTGVTAHFVIPSAYIVVVGGPIKPVPTLTTILGTQTLHGIVLLVEDNLIIALDAEAMLMALGASKVLIASSVKDAFAMLDKDTPTFALLDVNLGNHNSFPIATRLQGLAVPYVFATGYGSGITYPPDQQTTPFISKPYTKETIARALAQRV